MEGRRGEGGTQSMGASGEEVLEIEEGEELLVLRLLEAVEEKVRS